MPKRPKTTVEDEKTTAKTKMSANDKASFSTFWAETKVLVQSKRFLFACGVVLACAVIYGAMAFVSFFFTGADDYSILDSNLAGAEMRDAIHNIGGIMGARLQQSMVNDGFGVLSIAIWILLGIYAIGLMKIREIKLLKSFFHAFFWLVWGSTTCAFVQGLIPSHSMFIHWGGAHGEWMSNLLLNSVDWLGTMLILLAIVIVYFVAISRNTIPVLQKMGGKAAGVFHKGETADDDSEAIDGEEQPAAEGLLLDDEESANAGDDIVEVTDNTIDLSAQLGVAPKKENPSKAADPVLVITNPTDEAEAIDGEAPLLNEPEDDIVELPDEPTTEAATTTEANDGEVPNDTPVTTTSDEAANASDDVTLTIEDKPVEELLDKNDPEAWLQKVGPYDPRKDLENYKFPALDLLKVYDNENTAIVNQEEQQSNANRIVTTLRNYGVEIESIKATVGPTVTLYEVVPKAGVRIAKIQTLEADIMLSLAAEGIRIIAPMPGKGTVGIEVPNEKPQVVSMHSVIASKRFQEEKKMKLPIALGRTITNDIFMFDLAKTPHLLVAGATGQGKSVAINAIITSLLYKKHPAEMKLVMVDPKMVEFAPYKPLIRHYLAAMPDTEEKDVIITDCSKVIDVLNSLVIEMENRYTLLMDAGVRNLEEYNEKFINRRLNPDKLVADKLHHQYLPYIVIVIDEYGDFIMQAGKQVETPIARITQKARAVGMHMILATQRPSVNIVTGVIKANIPTRIALRTQSVVDSRTVLDAKGADQLIGRGDLLYSGSGSITRVQCAFVDTPEVDAIVDHVKAQQHYFAPYELPEYVGEGGEGEALAPGAVDLKKLDPMFADVARYVVANQQGSTSVLQRKFEIGYNRAGKLSDQLEAAGIVSPAKGSKGRDVLVQDDTQLMEIFRRLELM